MASAWLLRFGCLVAIATGFHAGLRPRACAPQGLGCAPRQPRVARVSLLEPAATHGTSYQELKSIDSKVDELQSDVIDMLLGFYDRRRSCFALTPGRSRYSITSTCCSLLAVDAARVRWRDQARLHTQRLLLHAPSRARAFSSTRPLQHAPSARPRLPSTCAPAPCTAQRAEGRGRAAGRGLARRRPVPG